MLMLAVIGLAVVAFLGQNLVKRLTSDHIQQLMDGRRASSRIVTRAELIDGSRHLPVSLALSELAIYYESAEMQASLDLEWIEEVEYESDPVTGQYVGDRRLLRLRCYSQAFEFLIPAGDVAQWQILLPAHGLVLPAATPRAESALQSKKEQSRADDDGWPTPPPATVAAASLP